MEWTYDMPTKPGWYWWRYDALLQPDIHYLIECPNQTIMELDSDGVRHDLLEDGQWAGPIELPTSLKDFPLTRKQEVNVAIAHITEARKLLMKHADFMELGFMLRDLTSMSDALLQFMEDKRAEL